MTETKKEIYERLEALEKEKEELEEKLKSPALTDCSIGYQSRVY